MDVFIYSNLLCARTEIFPGYSYHLATYVRKKIWDILLMVLAKLDFCP